MSSSMQVNFDRKKFYQLQLLRLALAWVITLFVARAIDLGIGNPLLLLSVSAGTLFAGLILSRGKTFIVTALVHGLIFLAAALCFSAANTIITAPAGSAATSDFLVSQLADKTLLLGIFYSIAFLTTWFFWTRPQAVTIEAVLYSTAFLWLLSGHRNYHIDAPKQISSLSWKVGLFQQLHLEPQHIFLALGVLFVLFLSVYFILASGRTLFGAEETVQTYGKKQKLTLILCPLLAGLLRNLHQQSVFD